MQRRAARHDQVLDVLVSSSGWITAADLGARIDASPRSVRDYVRQINSRHSDEVILSGQEGYRLNHAEYRRYREGAASRRPVADDREQRLYAIVRRLVAHREPVDVFALADDLFVSSSTIEGDLGRARELLREYGLTITRDRDTVRIEGAERQRRRLMRFLLFTAGSGGLTQGLTTLDDVGRRSALRRLRARSRPALAGSAIDVNEYALNDILVHLTIAAERVAEGYYIEEPEDVDLRRSPLWPVVDGLADAVEHVHGVRLPASELSALHRILLTHSTTLDPVQRAELQAALPVEMTRGALREVSAQFGLDMYDESTVTRLALHVQNLIARSRLDQSLETPLGISFRATHPFIHELALMVARHIEAFAGIQISDGEIDFLAFHLGNQVQRQVHQGPPLTITCVVPQYGVLHDDLPRRLAEALRDQAVVQDVVTSVVDDWTLLTSDLVVSVIDLPPHVPVPVIKVSPFLTEDDIARVVSRVQSERLRLRQDKLRATVVSLFDPALFQRTVDVSGKDDAIHVLCAALEREGYVSGPFEEDVLDRESRSPTSFGGAFAIPHSLYMDAEKTGIAVLVLDQGIAWGPSHAVRLVLMFSVSPDGRATFRDVLDELTRVLSEPSNISALVERSVDHHAFARALSDLLIG